MHTARKRSADVHHSAPKQNLIIYNMVQMEFNGPVGHAPELNGLNRE
jgi:hypothetical protein